MSVSEWSLPIVRGGVASEVGEYSISAIGPGPRAKRHWAAARERGLPAFAKIQAGTTWELGSVPYLPALNNVAEIDDFVAQAVITHHHPCGTCRMGKDDDAVVDPDLRFKALDNLFIVDASIMPNLTTGPIHAAVLAIAETFARTFADDTV